MISKLVTFSLAAAVTLGALSVAPATARADTYLGLGGGRSGPSVEFFVGEGRRFGHDDRDRGGWRHGRDDDRRWDRGERRHGWDRHERGCSVDRALFKAERMGVRRARVLDAGRRTIDVGGRMRGERVVVSFSRAPGCPIVGGW